jgi:hypothetical protein
MKTFTSTERAQIRARIEAATGQPFEYPQPEYFLSENHGAIGTGVYTCDGVRKMVVLHANGKYSSAMVVFNLN